MVEYIDREAIIKAIDNNFAKLDIDVCNPPYYDGANDEYADVRLIIHKQPAADVQPIIHAKWEIYSDGYYPYCSNCKTEPDNGTMSNFCPMCGADMRTKI